MIDSRYSRHERYSSSVLRDVRVSNLHMVGCSLADVAQPAGNACYLVVAGSDQARSPAERMRARRVTGTYTGDIVLLVPH